MTDRPDQGQDDTEAGALLLGPDEIVNYELRRSTRGYHVGSVDDLLDQLAVQTQDLLVEVGHLRRERNELQAALDEEREAETTLKKTLLTAQRAAEASLAEARSEADGLKERARQRANEMLAEAAEQAHELRETALRRARAEEAEMRRHRRAMDEHIQLLRSFAEDHRVRLHHHLEQQQARLDAMELPDPPPAPQRASEELLDEELPAPEVRHPEEELEAILADAEAEANATSQGGDAPQPEQVDLGADEAVEADLFGEGS